MMSEFISVIRPPTRVPLCPVIQVRWRIPAPARPRVKTPRRVHFALFTLRHEYYDVELGKWMNFGWHPTIHTAQFPASVLLPRKKNDDGD